MPGADEFNIAAYHKALKERKIAASSCTRCNAVFLPPRVICSHCHAQAMTWMQLEGEGKVLGFTSIAITPTSMTYRGYGRTNPSVTALVELKEGPCISARLEGVDSRDLEKSVKVGMSVQADFLSEDTARMGLRGRASGRQVTLVFRPKK
ncbi:MAG: hypothetical protein EXR55_00930 [Dehalococcoidia bacterium]|nr:hypothetical protein [Dehalococcoidia bacterium]